MLQLMSMLLQRPPGSSHSLSLMLAPSPVRLAQVKQQPTLLLLSLIVEAQLMLVLVVLLLLLTLVVPRTQAGEANRRLPMPTVLLRPLAMLRLLLPLLLLPTMRKAALLCLLGRLRLLTICTSTTESRSKDVDSTASVARPSCISTTERRPCVVVAIAPCREVVFFWRHPSRCGVGALVADRGETCVPSSSSDVMIL